MSQDGRTEGFRGLVVWQKAQAFALEVSRQTGKLPRTGNGAVMVNQLVRAAGSVPANIAEGYGRYSQGAYRNHLSIARGSLFESESWIDLMLKDGHLSNEVATELLGRCHELARLLTQRMRALESGFRTREDGPYYDAC
ncbi:MAG TPA: four helix bundle protein [Dehalococcoidia bacterium]|jgi:four helix bundle protein